MADENKSKKGEHMKPMRLGVYLTGLMLNLGLGKREFTGGKTSYTGNGTFVKHQPPAELIIDDLLLLKTEDLPFPNTKISESIVYGTGDSQNARHFFKGGYDLFGPTSYKLDEEFSLYTSAPSKFSEKIMAPIITDQLKADNHAVKNRLMSVVNKIIPMYRGAEIIDLETAVKSKELKKVVDGIVPWSPGVIETPDYNTLYSNKTINPRTLREAIQTILPEYSKKNPEILFLNREESNSHLIESASHKAYVQILAETQSPSFMGDPFLNMQHLSLSKMSGRHSRPILINYK